MLFDTTDDALTAIITDGLERDNKADASAIDPNDPVRLVWYTDTHKTPPHPLPPEDPPIFFEEVVCFGDFDVV